MAKRSQLLNGTVEGSEVLPDPSTKSITKLMKAVSVTRTPGGRIARIDLNTSKGLVELEIDEPTARAIAKVFDDVPD